MSNSKHIPVGRISQVSTNSMALQVQTEYASRPYPRVTTTVTDNGRVVRKVEQRFPRPVSSVEDQSRVERIILEQHGEVMSVLKGKAQSVARPHRADSPPTMRQNMTEQLAAIPGVQRVLRLTADGDFVSENASAEFKRTFGSVFKNLRELMGVFVRLPHRWGQREKGVCEIERDRLYLASAGSECFFVLVRSDPQTANFEEAIKGIVSPLGSDDD